MKPKVRFALQYPSGAGGMFLTELVDNTPWEDSGCWDTNPGCRRNLKHNEYGGSVHCVQVDGSNEALPTTEQSILVAKQDIHKYLPFYDCPVTYVIDASDNDSFDYTASLMFLKKWCGWIPFRSDVQDMIERSVPQNILKYDSIDKYSKIVLKYIAENPPCPFEEFVRICYDTWMKESRESRPDEYWDKSHKRNLSFDIDGIERHSELQVINYADLFLFGLPTGTIFDKYSSDIQEYRVRNDQLLDTFEREFRINN